MNDGQSVVAHEKGWIASLKVYTGPKMAMMLILGFAAGLPFLLYFSTLGYWLERSDIDVAIIGFFSWFGLSYSFKFIWAPLVDRFDPPGFSKIFGRRRAWIFVAQIGVAIGLAGIGLSDPTKNLGATALFSFLLAFSSATQDIGIDAWRIEAADSDEDQAPLAAAYQYGYKVGMIIAGGVALFIAQFTGFPTAYLAMAACMITAALVFSIWDRPTGLHAAASGGIALLSVGLYTAFNSLGDRAPEGVFSLLLNAVGWLFLIVAALSGLFFIYALVRALFASPDKEKFSIGDVITGIIFTVGIVGVVAAAAIGIGKLVPSVLSALSIELSRGDVGRIAVYIAFTPLLLCVLAVPFIRRLAPDASLLRHPALGAFVDFFWRNGWTAITILLFVSAYRLSDIVMGIMAKPAYSAMGYEPAEVGLVSGVYGAWIVFLGVALAGLSAVKIGMRASLVIGALISIFGNLTFAWLVNQSSDSLFPLFLAITADNIAGGYAGTIFVAYMSTLVNKSFAGTQYAIFSSVYSLGPKLIAGTSGLIVAAHGYSSFFLFAAALGIPAVFLSFLAGGWKMSERSS